MAAGAGFLLDPTPHAPPRNSVAVATAHSSSNTPIEPRRLTASQLTRLRSHLDDALLSIQRRFARRFHDAGDPSSSSSSSLATLSSYTTAWTTTILPLVSRIDPFGSAQTATLTAYAMAIADAAPNGITGYDLPQAQEARGEALLGALELLGLIDALWAALLVGRSLSLPLARRRVRARLGVLDTSTTSGDDDDDDAKKEQPKMERMLRDTVPVSGSLGARTTSATDRVRLRNLLIDRKEAIIAWVGEQVGVRLPEERREEEEKEERRRGSRSRRGERARADGQREVELDGIREVVEEAEDPTAPNGDDEDDDAALEEVTVPAVHANGGDDDEGGGTAEERGHYRDLFARKLDPDGDDDSGSDGETEEESELGQEAQGGQDGVQDDTRRSTKRRRVDEDKQERERQLDSGAAEETSTAAAQTTARPTADQENHSSTFKVPTDALAIERLTSQVFSRSLAALERLDAAAMAAAN